MFRTKDLHMMTKIKNYTKRSANRQHLIWQLPLIICMLAFGILTMAQYQSHLNHNGLENESDTNLAQIIKSVSDRNAVLHDELDALTAELNTLKASISNEEALVATLTANIDTIKAAIGFEEVSGSGITLTITETANLIYKDIIDIVNELMNSGAEAVCINNVRVTSRTQISQGSRTRTVAVDDGQGNITHQEATDETILLNGKELASPIIIKAIGNPATLETALTYPGGILEGLTTLIKIQTSIKQSATLVIPTAEIKEFEHAAPATEGSSTDTPPVNPDDLQQPENGNPEDVF